MNPLPSKPADVGSLVVYVDPRGMDQDALILELKPKKIATIKVFRTARKDLVLENIPCGYKPGHWHIRSTP